MDITIQRHCHHHGCYNIPGFRCRACRTSCCFRNCQEQDWYRHSFCVYVTLHGRPNFADSLILLLQRRQDAQVNDSLSKACTKEIVTNIDRFRISRLHDPSRRKNIDTSLQKHGVGLADRNMAADLDRLRDTERRHQRYNSARSRQPSYLSNIVPVFQHSLSPTLFRNASSRRVRARARLELTHSRI